MGALPSTWADLIHLPAPLCSTGVTPILSSYGRSVRCAGLHPRAEIPAARHLVVQPFSPQTPARPRRRFPFHAHSVAGSRTLAPLHAARGRPAARAHPGFAVTPPARRRGQAESGSSSYRPAVSPPAAPHPALLRRSCSWLRVLHVTTGRTCTVLTKCARRRTERRLASGPGGGGPPHLHQARTVRRAESGPRASVLDGLTTHEHR